MKEVNNKTEICHVVDMDSEAHLIEVGLKMEKKLEEETSKEEVMSE